MKDYSVTELKVIAKEIRKGIIEAIHFGGSGHPGGSLSIAEILTVLYFREMNIDPDQPQWEDRDRFVLSKGHAAPALYAALAQRGYFSKEVLKTLRHVDSILQGHPDMKKTPGVDMSTGSLGQGISAACGMACYGKKAGKKYHVYAVLGDGEMQEGMVWEAVMSAGHNCLDNLIVYLDNNNLQIDGDVDKLMSIYPVKEKFNAFGWNVIEIDGHDIEALISATETAKQYKGKPTIMICKTVKGKNVHFMENQAGWHGASINDEQYLAAMAELENNA